MEHRRRDHELIEQEIDARLPLRPERGAFGLEDRIGDVEADDTMNRRREVELERLAAGRAFNLQRLR
jgi:hypothetical protein